MKHYFFITLIFCLCGNGLFGMEGKKVKSALPIAAGLMTIGKPKVRPVSLEMQPMEVKKDTVEQPGVIDTLFSLFIGQESVS